MHANLRILAGVSFSVASTMVAMAIMASFPGMDVPLAWWIFAFCAPLLISAPVCILLVRQGERNRALHADLHNAFARMKRLSEVDQMTGLLNRTTFLAAAEAKRHDAPGACLLIDIDHFKAVNDHHGHHAGDEVLRAVAHRLRTGVRAQDLCGRIGGEEFAIYLADTDRDTACAMAERLRDAVAQLSLPTASGGVIRPTVSIGVADGIDGTTLQDSLRQADIAMYEAKRGGRNQVRLIA